MSKLRPRLDSTKLYKRSDCEVTLQTLRNRLSKGEKYSTARRLRNFVYQGVKYPSLMALSKVVHITYGQLRYRVCTCKLTPEQAVALGACYKI